jgi:hypothetical protein
MVISLLHSDNMMKNLLIKSRIEDILTDQRNSFESLLKIILYSFSLVTCQISLLEENIINFKRDSFF